MMKQKTKLNCCKFQGVPSVCEEQKGITLIALVITIIVMILLVIVVINLVLGEADVSQLPEIEAGVKATEKSKYISGTDIAVIPEGFTVSNEEGEQTISTGLVVKDFFDNEFVWIPVDEDFTSSYNSPREPFELSWINYYSSDCYDSQATLDYYYGENCFHYPANDTEKSDVNQTFAYSAHYAEMVTSVNKYHGFYIGRYETTIDGSSKIGSKYNTPVLTVDKTTPQTEDKPYRWWGLYCAQRNSDVYGNGTNVQTNMIWGQQWNAMLAFLGTDKAKSEIEFNETAYSPLNSGQARYTVNEESVPDEMNNIYDLRRNVCEWTAEAQGTDHRVYHGSDYYDSLSASNRGDFIPIYNNVNFGSRLVLYIK